MARKPRVLLISFVFPPMIAGGAVRVGRFAKYLPEFGWDVTVVTGPAVDAIDTAAMEELPPGVRIIRVRAPLANAVRRHAAVASQGHEQRLRRLLRNLAQLTLFPDRQILWALAASRTAIKAASEQHHDAVLASYPPASSLVAGFLTHQATGLPLITDFRDLWTDLPGQEFASALHAAAARRLQRHIVHRATRVIGVTSPMAETLTAEHPLGRDAAMTIPNGFDPAHAALVRDERDLSSASRPFTLLYAGSLNAHYDLSGFWQALQRLVQCEDMSPDSLRVQFISNLSPKDPAHWGLQDFVDILPMRPQRDVFTAMNQADALMLVERPGYYPEFTIAAKAFDYLLTGKPVLGLTESPGHTADLLNEAGVGYCADPRDPGAIEQALRGILRTHRYPPKSVDLAQPPYRRHDRRQLAGQLAHAFR